MRNLPIIPCGSRIALCSKMNSRGSLVFLIFLLATFCSQNPGLSSAEVLQTYNNEYMVGCYFPAEFQGEFVMQVSGKGARGSSNMGEPVQYSTVNITYNSIPVWGYCHKRVGENVLLMNSYGEECIRCFRLMRRSRNVIEVFSENLNRCYTSGDSAIASCEKLNSTAILYRTKEIGGTPIRNEYCPIEGRYHFKYNVNDGSEDKIGCNKFSSDFDNCPEGSEFHLKFRCSMENHDIKFNCLGSWEGGPDGSRYIALLDTREGGERRTQYRCGLYHVDNNNGKTYLAFSSDSSCDQNLVNSTSGYETLVLSKTSRQNKMPSFVKTHFTLFPKWAQGEWEQSLIVNGTMTFTDLNGYKSYTFVAVDANDESGLYIVYSRDQCEQEAYVCLKMRQRSENVFEFTTGTKSSLIYQSSLCDELYLDTPIWMTQARIERIVESPCPITGLYTGMITDLPGMCAELSSNCNTREIMYYKVSDCKSGELYEERTYLCLGQWEEKGVMYTYTKRNDTGTNECFVGLIVNDEEIYIKEAGDHCIRNIDPKKQGMRLYKEGQCYGHSPSPAPTAGKPIPHNPIMFSTTTHRSSIPDRTTEETSSTIQSSGYDNAMTVWATLIAALAILF